MAKFGGELGTIVAAADMWMRTLKIGLPITMKHHADYEDTGRADLYQPIAYPKPDGVISFDRLTSVSFSFTNHAEDQPCHLQVADLELQKLSELERFAGPSARYCPAGVYEWVAGGRRRAALPDQLAELRALQDLRHQGPEPEYQLGHAGRGRGAELSEYVRGVLMQSMGAVLSASLFDRECRVQRREGDWNFNFGDHFNIAVSVPWRIVTASGIALGGEDDGVFGVASGRRGQRTCAWLSN